MRVALLTLMLAVAAVAVPVSAQALVQSYQLNIPRQPLDTALKDLAQQTGLQIARFSDTPGGTSLVGPVSGEMTVGQALNSLLVSGLTYKMVNDHTIAVVAVTKASITSGASTSDTPTSQSSSPGLGGNAQKEGKNDSSSGFLVAQAATGQGAGDVSVERSKTLERKTEQLQEVIVTAERRETDIQRTPISLTAVSGSEIQDRGLVDLNDLTQSVPGVSMHTSGPGQTEYEMRGMASTGGNSPTVGFYLDDTSITAPAFSVNSKVVIDPNLYDLSRVEVLRGPQGTLYGSGSMGGTIKVITNPPNPAAFSASAEGTFSDTDGGGFNHALNGMLNVPFASNTAALRVVASRSYTSGWIDRIVIANGAFPLELTPQGNVSPTGTVRGNVLAAPVAADYRNVNNEDLRAVRASLIWTPTERFTADLSYFYEHISQNGASYIDSVPGTDAHYQPFDTPEPFTDYFNLGSVNLRYRFDTFDVTSITSYWNRDVTFTQDANEEWQWVLGLPSYYTSSGGIGAFSPTPYEADGTKQISEELRLVSSGSSPFQWLFGYYYEGFTDAFYAPFFVPGAIPLFGSSDFLYQNQTIKLSQQALFGELSYQLTPQLKATAGARRYAYDEDVNNTEAGILGPSGSNTPITFLSAERHQGVNPKFGLSYQANDELLLYTSAAKGFRPGGGDNSVPTSGQVGDVCEQNLQSVYNTSSFVPAPRLFGPDTVWTYELGEKLTAFQDRVVINGAAYFSNWSDIQQTVPLPCSYFFTANAGDAHIYGGELEVRALLGKGFTLSVNGGYTHATLVSSNVYGVGIDPGTRVQDVPQWTSSQQLSYRHELSDGLAFVGRAENDYVGSRIDATYGINQLPSYDLTSVRAGVETGNWSAMLFATNVFNERALISNVMMISINLPSYNRVVIAQPLTVGIDFQYRFGR